MHVRLSIPAVVGLIVALEIVREMIVLNRLGFNYMRFAEWMCGKDAVAGTVVKDEKR